jgi:hypothetical protein
MGIRVCYLDCHEAGLCCYLVIHIRKPITSTTAVLLPFVTYLLTLPRGSGSESSSFANARSFRFVV